MWVLIIVVLALILIGCVIGGVMDGIKRRRFARQNPKEFLEEMTEG
jgi:hypothetical protein